MANVMFKKGLLANLPGAYAEGTFYVTTDEHGLYLDISDSQRIRIGDFQEFATLDALKANTNPSTSALYYITDLNVMAKWNGTEYIQINLDTGATSFEVVGDGNAVTSVSYDETTRKLTLTKGETFATQAYVGNIPDGYTETNIVAYINKKAEETLNTASGGSSESAASVLAALNTYKAETEPRLEALEAIDHDHTNKAELDLIESGDKAKWDAAEQNAKNYADQVSGAVQTKLDEEVERAKAAEGANAKAAEDAMNEAKAKVASVAAADASVTVAGTSTAPTIAAKLSQDADNALTLAEDGLKVVIPAAAEYSIVKAEDSGDYAAVYNLTKDGTIVGASINIPKDIVVKSGSVVGDEIVLVLNDEAATEIKIPVASLIEYVTSGSVAGDMIVVNVSDDHKVTATITDGTITLAKLHTDVQTAIGKVHTHENADVLNGITADKVAAWDAAEQNAKDHADGLNTAMDGRMQAVEGKAHEHANAEELAKIAEGDVAKWNAAEQNAKDYADGLASNYDAAGSASTAEQNAKAYADSLVLVWGEF